MLYASVASVVHVLAVPFVLMSCVCLFAAEERKPNAVVSCELCDSTSGNPLKTESNGKYNPTLRSVGLACSFKNPLLANVDLQFRVQKNTRKVRVPFHFENIEVPPVPTR